MKDLLDDRIDGTGGFSETGIKRRARLIAAGGEHSFSKDVEREERNRSLLTCHKKMLSPDAAGTSTVPIDMSGAPGSENGSTDPSPAAEPAMPAAPAAAPPA